jgi:2-iminobutanoate/2-iminopropanoate deaminase
MNTFLKAGERQEHMDCVSSFVQLRDFFYVSGQLGEGDTFRDQCVHACFKVKEILHDFDLRFDHILKFTVYLTDIEMQDTFLDVFANFADQPYPAVTIVEVSRLAHDSMVCIEGSGINTLRHERSMEEAYCEDCDD